MAETYQPPQTLWEVSEQIRFNEPLAGLDDPRYVDTAPGRELGYRRLLRNLGVDEEANQLRAQHSRQYSLFCGHRGSGKSTELRRLRDRLSQNGLFQVIFLDVVDELNVNNLQYPDVCLALAKRLFAELAEREGLVLDQAFLTPLENWFRERILVQEKYAEIKAGIEAGAKAEGGIPFLTKLFASFTTTLQGGAKSREEIRTEFRSFHSDFTRAFNALIGHVEEVLARDWAKPRLLFIVDGTDRLDAEDSRRFFVQDVYQIQEIDGLFIYCAPIHLIHDDNAVRQGFDHIYRIPCLKLHEKRDPRGQDKLERIEPTYKVLRELVLRRAASSLFDPDPEAIGDWSTVDYVIEHSGGHLRDLLRLLNYAFTAATGDKFDRASVEKAVEALAKDYQRILQPDDYSALAEVDAGGKEFVPSTEVCRKLLYNLALLEYNDYWWQSHPAVRTLPAYRAALA